MEQESKTSSRSALYALFAIVVLGAAMGNLSQTAVNTMLNDIMSDFNMVVELGQWLTTGYMLMLGITIPVVSYLTRRFCIRTQVSSAFVILIAGSLCALFAPNFWLLFIGRILQAIATGLVLPLLMTLAMTRFPQGQQATAMGIAGIAMGFAPNIGPTIGGAMSVTWGWRSFFILMLAVAAVLIICAFIAIKPEEPDDRSAHLDVISVIESTIGFGGLLLGFSNASSYEFTHPYIWIPLVIGIVFLVLFILRQRRVDKPLISMDIFKSSSFRAGFIGQILLYASFMGITLIIPLYIENLCGGTALDAGFVLLPAAILALFINPLSGFLADRLGTRPVSIVAGICLAVGATLMAFMDATTPLLVVIIFQSIRSIGVSGLINPLTTWSLAELPETLVADGSSFATATRQATAALSTSIMVLILTAVSSMGIGLANPALAYQLSFGFSAVCGIAALVVVAIKVR